MQEKQALAQPISGAELALRESIISTLSQLEVKSKFEAHIIIWNTHRYIQRLSAIVEHNNDAALKGNALYEMAFLLKLEPMLYLLPALTLSDDPTIKYVAEMIMRSEHYADPNPESFTQAAKASKDYIKYLALTEDFFLNIDRGFRLHSQISGKPEIISLTSRWKNVLGSHESLEDQVVAQELKMQSA